MTPAITRMLVVAVVVATAGPALVSGSAHASERSRGVMRVDDHKRTYSLFVPSRAPRMAAYDGVVVALHPGGRRENGRRMEEAVDLNDQARRHGWIVIYPDALGGRFHAGECCGRRSSRTDDIRFVERLVQSAKRRYPIRRGRVFATGFSNGGFLVYRLACQTRLLTAVAAVAATELTRPCRPQRPVSIMHIHARDDRTVRFAGGTYRKWAKGALGLVAQWRSRNDCPNGRTTRQRSPDLLISTTSGCSKRSRVVLVAPTRGGHAWPGAHPSYGPGAAGLDATGLIADFFSRTRP